MSSLETVLSGITAGTAILYLLAALLLVYRLRGDVIAILPALLFTAFWSLAPGLHIRLDLVLVALWSGSLLFYVRSTGVLGEGIVRTLLPWVLPALGLFIALIAPLLEPVIVIYAILLLLIALLMVTELVIRTSHGSLRAMGIGMGTLFLFELYFYVQSIAAGFLAGELILSRILLNGTIALLLSFTPFYIFNEHRSVRRMGLSRPAVVTTTSTMLAGLIISIIGLTGLLLRTQLSDYWSMAQVFLVFLCILLIGFNLGSSTQRARIRVWVNKNFFDTKHEHSHEWKLLSERLSVLNADNFEETALTATMAIYNASQGIFYTRSGDLLTPSVQLGLESTGLRITEDSPFMNQAASGWIFVQGATDENINQSFSIVPDELKALSDQLVIVPLSHSGLVIGVIVFIPEAVQGQDFDWEDLDLMKTVAGQVSSFVAFQQLNREKVVRQQFEMYHQFTTFVMHDLRNLVAQQELVVSNASRFTNNPEFFADAIETIEHSVQRMNRLIRKINEHEVVDWVEPVSPTLLDTVLEDVLAGTVDRLPLPELDIQSSGLHVLADSDSLTMAFTHLVTNAQESCEADGSVKLTLVRSDCGKQAILQISDTGTGLTQEFIENRLFKPFDTTKKTVGMGVGAYQSEAIISKIGGNISVDSTLGEGSCFTITMPLAAN